MSAPTVEEVREAMRRLYLGDAVTAAGASPPSLRREDRRKAEEVSALLAVLARRVRPGRLVDAAAGHAYVGLLAVELLGWRDVVLVERDPARVARCEAVARRLSRPAQVTIRQGEVGSTALWPTRPDAVVALHACGPAADGVIDAATAVEARWLLLVPCCYGQKLALAPRAALLADDLGLPALAPIRRHLLQAVVDGERALRLEAAGYAVEAAPLVAETVTPHNLLLLARRVGEVRRMAEARGRLARLRGPAIASAPPPAPGR